jgi:alkylated DNA repair dioxygenase AlkB
VPFTSQELPEGGVVNHDPAFLPPEEASSLAARLSSELCWEQRAIVLFGREIMQPRLVAWGGDVQYRYSGQTLDVRPMTSAVREVLDRVVRTTGEQFNHVLANRYRDERDGMGFHSDDEPELGTEPVVATVSWGAPRRRLLVPQHKPITDL